MPRAVAITPANTPVTPTNGYARVAPDARDATATATRPVERPRCTILVEASASLPVQVGEAVGQIWGLPHGQPEIHRDLAGPRRSFLQARRGIKYNV